MWINRGIWPSLLLWSRVDAGILRQNTKFKKIRHNLNTIAGYTEAIVNEERSRS